MKANEWITLVIAILTLVAGSGWGKYLLERRNAKREAARSVLDGFLLPLQAILGQSKRFHHALTENQDFKNLEYAADYLQQHFASLPDTDSRKLAWQTMIEGMLEDNRRAVLLIQKSAGKFIREDFRKACDDFVHHANMWEAVWRSTLGRTPVPDSMHGAGRLAAPPFPEAMNSLLSQEIADRRRQAGE